MGTKAEKVYSITSARRALSEDVDDRNMRYLVTMVIRTVCVLAVALIPHWYRWLFAVGAVVLPILAVLVVNAGREPRGSIDETTDPRSAQPHPARQIPAGTGPTITPEGALIDTRELPVGASPVATGEDESGAGLVSARSPSIRQTHPEWFADDSEYLR
ncbi:MAG: DUF3099 domain-containing protein [Bowdeniella nasicola]|nr:DUF3099 domain-containing protein [Bowdeniella nasicola]